jgi:hypothetical protein
MVVAHVGWLDSVLTTSVAGLMHRGLVTLERVAQDGMRARATVGGFRGLHWHMRLGRRPWHRADDLKSRGRPPRRQLARRGVQNATNWMVPPNAQSTAG